MRKIVWIGAAVMLLAAAVWTWRALSGDGDAVPPAREGVQREPSSCPQRRGTPLGSEKDGTDSASPQCAADVRGTSGVADNASADERKTEEDASAEEAKVDAFDGLTDKWMEPSKAGVTMKDVDAFVSSFRQVPKNRQDECIHRALNLIPDENVMLLAGVLMDKTMDKEVVETVFNDILNRDEDVKKPILQQVFKDKSHPCWADTAWILDVTGEAPVTSK